LAEAVIARGTVLERALTLTAEGRLLADMPLGEMSRRFGYPSVCVHRADLQEVLASAARPILGSECTGVVEDGDGAAVQFPEGRSERGVVVIGADGIRSAIRAHLHGPTEPDRAGYIAYRGIARFRLPEAPPDRSRLILGPGAQTLHRVRCRRSIRSRRKWRQLGTCAATSSSSNPRTKSSSSRTTGPA
ncbi:MAG TPA: hypothetical protein VN641_07040, partial [Urbifossiella sp.]|nr:hypothetical protein [Urbifossiella sp.]